jgi:hypothetical protein
MSPAQEAALAVFLDTWAELLPALPDDYDCHLTCREADAAARLFRVFGYPVTAGDITAAHAAHDTAEDYHYAGGTP